MTNKILLVDDEKDIVDLVEEVSKGVYRQGGGQPLSAIPA